MDQLEQRVAVMEKSLKLYRIFFGLVIIAISTIALMSSREKNYVPDKLQAKSFEVLDDRGNVIAELSQDKGNGSLTTFTPAGKRLVDLFTSEGGAGGINTFDNDGDVLFKVTRTTGGGAYLALFNEDAKEITELGVTDNKSGYLKVNDKYGDKLAYITYTADGGGYFSLSNNNLETIRFSTPAVGGRIGISNRRNTRIAYIGTQDSQDGNITIFNNAGTSTGSIPNK